MKKPVCVGAILFPGFEMLDLFGPLEMYSVLGSAEAKIVTVAETAGPVATAMGHEGPVGPKVMAEYGFEGAPELDILLVPGGVGTRAELENQAMLAFLAQASSTAEITTSVCTGSALLAKAGVLDGLRATTNKQFFALARMQSEAVQWVEAARWVDAGSVVTSSGVTAGMDMTLAVIARVWGEKVAEDVAAGAEYTWQRDPDLDPFIDHLDEGSRRAGLIR